LSSAAGLAEFSSVEWLESAPKTISLAKAKQSAQKTMVAKKNMTRFAKASDRLVNCNERKNLFVGQRDNGIVTGGTQRRIDSADGGADESEQSGREDPLRGN